MRRIHAQGSVIRSSKIIIFPKLPVFTYRHASSQPRPQEQALDHRHHSTKKNEGVETKKQGNKKTIAELDAELQQKMSGLSGDGGAAGVEYEDGQPVAMKRSVKNNMFRYI